MMEKIYWAKVKENAKIPSKRWEDAGYDLYPCFAADGAIKHPIGNSFVSQYPYKD